MRDALYLNGVFESVLNEIAAVQSVVPDLPLFLQPYSDNYVALLAKDPPTADDPVRLFASTSDDLAHVRYVAEIIGWADKRTMSNSVKHVFERLIGAFQPGEKNFYEKGVNAIMVRRMIALEVPFPVSNLVVRSTMKPHGIRSQPGGWSFVLPDSTGFVLPQRPTSPWGWSNAPRRESHFDEIPVAETEDGSAPNGD